MEKLTNIIESIVYVSGNAVEIKDIAEKLGVPEKEILKSVKELQERYSGASGLHLLMFNKKLQFSSNPDYADQVAAVLNPIRERELSRSMLETAAIIAYKQPVTRLDLEEIRGNSEYAVQKLLELKVIEPVGWTNCLITIRSWRRFSCCTEKRKTAITCIAKTST